MDKIVKIEAPGLTTYIGTIVDLKPGESVTVQYKPQRRSKPTELTLMWNDVVYVAGAEGEVGGVTVKLAAAFIADGKGSIKKIEGNAVVAEVNGGTVTVNSDNAKIYSIVDKVESGSTAKAAKSKDGGKKLKKKKKKK